MRIDKRPGNFLSLKWKATILTSLVLLVGAMAYTLISYKSLSQQFKAQILTDQRRDLRAIETALTGTLRRLEQFGFVVPTFAGMQSAFQEGGVAAVEDAFESNWPGLQLDMDIDIIRFYDVKGDFLTGHSIPGLSSPPTGTIDNWVHKANQADRPVSALYCTSDCVLYAVVPILVRGNEVGVLVLGTSIAEVIIRYRRVSGNDIALLLPRTADATGARETMVASWGVQVLALTNRQRTLPLLDTVAERYSLEALPEHPFDVGDRHYDLTLMPIVVPAGQDETLHIDDKLKVLGIRNVTNVVDGIRTATLKTLFAGLLGWVIFELLLMAVLWTPMSRLLRTTRNLPLLAEGGFERVREAIGARRPNAVFGDEIDVLNETAVHLSHQLEQLESEVEDRNRALSNRMGELAQERDFVQSLLDTAEVLILTLDREQRVLSLNNWVTETCGYGLQDLSGRRFQDLLVTDSLLPDLSHHLTELCEGRRNRMRHESLLSSRDGQERSVTWFHSRLAGNGRDGAVVLSVGLDITARKHAEHRLSWLDEHDALTGLPNRRAFRALLEKTVERSHEHEWRGALLLFDLDQFKFINDTDGHSAGDTALKMVADILRRQAEREEYAARIGGDDFALLMPAADAEAALALAKKVGETLAELRVSRTDGPGKLCASIGIALVPEHASTAGDLMASADMALAQSKEAGGGRPQLFNQDDQALERMKSNVYWKGRVAKALADDRFVIFLQPIAEVKSGTITHYEALLRIRDESGHLESPANFIEAAERSGLIQQVDRRVLSHALDRLSDLLRTGWDIKVAVNLSGQALCDMDLVRHLGSELVRTGVPPNQLIFEITETAAVADFATARQIMAEIRSLGCRFALDDFGVGFSSFYYLKQLPIDFVKIDGSFVTQLLFNPDDQILVRGLCQVATGFGKKIIAEFVENAETLALLSEFGIDYAQGYYIGTPRPVQEVLQETAAPPKARRVGMS